LPVSASALDQAAIQTTSALATDSLLRRLPGFDRTRSNSMFTNYGQLRVSFAGSGNDRGLVLGDGIPAQDGFGGQVDWSAYPTSDVQRAELLLGAGSALYGSGAVGGVLDMQTFGPTASHTPTGTFFIGAGTSAYSEQWARARGAVVPHLDASAIIQQNRSEYFALPPSAQSSNSGISRSSTSMAALHLRYSADVKDVFDVEQRGAWDYQFQGRPNYTFSRHLSQTYARFTHSAPQSSAQATIYVRSARVLNVADQFPVKPGVLRYEQDVPTSENGAALRWNVGGRRSLFELLADLRHIAGATTQFGPSGNVQSAVAGVQNLAGLAAQQTWQNDRFEVVAGARFDTVQEFQGRRDEAISARAAVRYDLSRQISMRLSSGSGLRAPFLNELLRGFFIGNVQFEPNPSLVPERSHTNSAGIDVLGARSHLSLDVFQTGVNDAIMFRTIDPTHQIRSNIAATQSNAYVFSYARKIGSCSRLTASATTQNARVTNGPAPIIGKQLQYVPKQSASVDYDTRFGKATAGVSISYLGQTFADDLNTQPLGTAINAGVFFGIPLPEGANLLLRADNITNARYLSSIDRYGPPATITLGVALPVGSVKSAEDTCAF
jgi:outer membrane cobalamin receptor